MKLLESQDGTIKVIELDPLKHYWIIADRDTGIDLHRIQFRNGMILMKHKGTEVTFVENPNHVEVPA